MKINTSNNDICPIEAAINLIKKKWISTIIRSIYEGHNQFTKLNNHLIDISKKVLVESLNFLVENKIIELKPIVNTYNQKLIILTKKGEELLDILFTLKYFGEKYEFSNCK